MLNNLFGGKQDDDGDIEISGRPITVDGDPVQTIANTLQMTYEKGGAGNFALTPIFFNRSRAKPR